MENNIIYCHLYPQECEALQWTDNYVEMKHFCGDNCTITFESCPLDDFFSLQVEDGLRGFGVNVPLNDYVVRMGNNVYTVIRASDFDEYFCSSVEAEEETPIDWNPKKTEIPPVLPIDDHGPLSTPPIVCENIEDYLKL